MRMNHTSPGLGRGGMVPPQPATLPGGSGAWGQIPEEEVVQLTLSRDGVWRSPVVAEPDSFAPRTSSRRPMLPRRLAPPLTQRYAPTGYLQGSPSTPGVLVDFYI